MRVFNEIKPNYLQKTVDKSFDWGYNLFARIISEQISIWTICWNGTDLCIEEKERL